MRFGWAVVRRFSVIWLVAASAFALVHSELHTSCPHEFDRYERPLLVDAAMFGVEMPADDAGTTFFVETSRVPLVVGETFGWRMHLASAPPQVSMREELTLPLAPASWRHDGLLTEISDDQRTAVTTRTVALDDGWLENYWSFTEGDPEGIYTLRIFIDDELAKEFRFRVEAVNGDGARVGHGCGGSR